VERFGSPEGVLAAAPGVLGELGLKPATISALARPDPEWIASVLAWAGQPGAWILARDDPRYPPLLLEITDPPTLLYVRGDPHLLVEPQVAIVGSRNPPPAGREITREFAPAGRLRARHHQWLGERGGWGGSCGST
jgi:DNA processing protein